MSVKSRFLWPIKALFTIVAFAVVNGCDGFGPMSSQELGATKSKGHPLTIATIKGPLTYSKNQSGWEQDLLESFADKAGYNLKWKVFGSEEEVFKAVHSGQADIGAGRLLLSQAFENDLLAGPAYEESTFVVVCPSDLKAEPTKLLVRPEDSPALRVHLWTNLTQTRPHQRPLSLLKAVARHENSCALVEKNESQFFLRFFPSLKITDESSALLSYGFVIRKDLVNIHSQLFQWFQSASRNAYLMRVRDRYFAHLAFLKRHDHKTFLRAIQERLQRMRPLFQRVANDFELPWTLVAAVAFQESQWENEAESFTGVKGIMMLTQETASHLGVEDRNDLEQSLWGGAKYLRYLLDSQPQFLHPRDRLILSLATYNVGPAHMKDAQKLAVRLGKSPYSWRDLRTVLPLLSEPEYYKTLDHGAARGQEPVDFANRILGYYEVLSYL